jgi:hypothetical protein
MATTEVEICNDALIIVGANKISDLSDNTKEAILCNEQYSKVRDQLLQSHPWNFAICRAEIAADVSLPTGWWDWEYAFTIPANCLRILQTESEDSTDWSVEGSKIFSNTSPLRIKYIKKETDVTKFSKGFEMALAYAIADRIGYALTQSSTLMSKIKIDFENRLSEARSYDGQENATEEVKADLWLGSRW